MCRAELPTPPNLTSQHVIVPIPVEIHPQPPKWKVVAFNAVLCGLPAGLATFVFWPLFTRPGG